MSSSSLSEAALELAWRLWTELGVPGVETLPNAPLVDPEPLVLWSASVVSADPRLRDLVFCWCEQHGERLSASRLRGLLKTMPPGVVLDFGRFVTALQAESNVKWPGADQSAPPWPLPQDARTLRVDTERPALVRLRCRALAGVGARADVLCELLAAEGRWVSASELAEQGYTKRSVARILSELDAAGITRSIRHGNALRYQLVDPAAVAKLVGAPIGALSPRWSSVFRLLALLTEAVVRLESESPIVQRVEAHRVREQVAEMAMRLGVSTPPQTQGNPLAFSDFVDWAVTEAEALADGSSAAFKVHL